MEELQVQYSLPSITTGLTKSQVKVLADNAVSHVLDEGNPLQVAEALSAMDEFVKTVRKDDRFIECVVEELSKTKGKLTVSSGAKLEKCETGISYDYSNNAAWVELDNQIKELSEQKKKLEERLKTIPAGKLLVDEETGESFSGPAKSSKDNYKVTLAK